MLTSLSDQLLFKDSDAGILNLVFNPCEASVSRSPQPDLILSASFDLIVSCLQLHLGLRFSIFGHSGPQQSLTHDYLRIVACSLKICPNL